MLDRREFVIAAGAASAVSVVLPAAAEPAPFFAVADRRFLESAAFAEEAARTGGTVHWIDGDVTDFWYGTLDLAWCARKTAVTGLTAPGALFCLARLAMDRGMRVTAKEEHGRSIRWVIA